MIPSGSGLGEGNQFRLLVITSRNFFANVNDPDNSKDIADFNALVSDGVGQNSTLEPYKADFRAIASTTGDTSAVPPIPAVHARDNTSTTGTGVPIYWFNGDKVADNYEDFYDDSWDSNSARDQDGTSLSGWSACTWTGTTSSGRRSHRPFGSSDLVTFACSHTSGDELSRNVANTNVNGMGLYALSPVFRIGFPSSASSAAPPQCTGPLRLALWTDRAGYLPGDTLRLYQTAERNCDRAEYVTFYYLERAGTDERRWFAPGAGSTELRAEPVDGYGSAPGAYRARRVAESERELVWEGQVPEPGLWRFVLEVQGPGEARRRFLAPFVVGNRSQLLNRRGFRRELAEDLDLRADTLYFMLGQLRVKAGATLQLEAGTLVQAWGREAEIVVEPGGRIEAEGTADTPVVLTCSSPRGRRPAGCWGGLRLLGRAPVTGLEPTATLGPAPAYGGTESGDSSGWLRWVRVEFAGAAASNGDPTAAVALRGAGAGTVLESVQAHASLGHGFLFDGGSASCEYCVASGPGLAGLAWDRGWQGAVRHLYVQHGPGGLDGIVGGSGGDSVDREPRSRPELSNVTLVHSASFSRESRDAAGLRLGGGTAVAARDLLVTGFPGGAVRARPRAAQLFGEEGGSAVFGAILYRNGYRGGVRQLRGVISGGVEFREVDPRLRNPRYWPNPDPRPRPDSSALKTGEKAEDLKEGTPPYVGAFGERDWLQGWTFFGLESDYLIGE